MARVATAFLILFSISLQLKAQSPSKATTIEYIQKRIDETKGHQVIWNTGAMEYIMSTSFGTATAKFMRMQYFNGNNSFMDYQLGNWYQANTFDFNPEYITSVVEGSGNLGSNSAAGFITITFSNNLVKRVTQYTSFVRQGVYTKYISNPAEQTNVNHLYLPYLKQDPTAFERIKKALLHLKQISVNADPFAN